MAKPIRVFFSPFSRRFYATRAYRIDERGLVTVTGEKFDVTNDIAYLIEKHQVEFREIIQKETARWRSRPDSTGDHQFKTVSSTPGSTGYSDI
jgi:hypothetical protein